MFLLTNRLGNEAFVAKNYDLALKHYGNAIKIDPENAIYYANNRFVCRCICVKFSYDKLHFLAQYCL